MTFAKRPPIPRSAKRIVWLSRAISGVALLIGLVVGARWAAEGRTTVALLVLAISIAYVLATWVNPLSPVLWIAIGSLVLILLVLAPGVMTITLAVAAALLFLISRWRQSPVRSSTLRPVFSDTVMLGAEAYVEELTELGWHHLGGYAFDSAGMAVTVSVLLHPGLDRYAEITDMVFGIESRFDGDLFLVTNNSGRAALPPNYLVNDVTGGSPRELADAHQRALDIVADRGLVPMRLDDEAIVEEALATEVETTEWSREHRSGGLLHLFKSEGVVDDSGRSSARIDAWLTHAAADQSVEEVTDR